MCHQETVRRIWADDTRWAEEIRRIRTGFSEMLSGDYAIGGTDFFFFRISYVPFESTETGMSDRRLGNKT